MWAFAPSLGCTIVALDRAEHNSIGLPTALFHSRLSFVTLGEPDQKLFEIPSGYQQKHYYQDGRFVKEWPYIWLDAFHGNTGAWIP